MGDTTDFARQDAAVESFEPQGSEPPACEQRSERENERPSLAREKRKNRQQGRHSREPEPGLANREGEREALAKRANE